jgi:hypothetical protein
MGNEEMALQAIPGQECSRKGTEARISISSSPFGE